MEYTDQLLTITQVSVAIVGFAGIIGTFQFKEGERIRVGDVVALEMMVKVGLMATFCSILPFILSNFGIDDASVWAIGSGFACVIYTYLWIYTANRIKNFRKYKTINKIMIYVIFIIAFVVVLINFLNIFNIVFKREFGPFYVSLIYALGSVCLMFPRLLLRPIWRRMRKQETENVTDDTL